MFLYHWNKNILKVIIYFFRKNSFFSSKFFKDIILNNIFIGKQLLEYFAIDTYISKLSS